MNGTIYKQAAIDAVSEGCQEWRGIFERCEEKLLALPSAQPEIVRCKDCYWYTINELKKDGTDDRRYKPSYCLLYSMHRDADWFCADGERKEDDSGV